MTNCEALNPSNNFEKLEACENAAEVELLFVGGKRGRFCIECAKTTKVTMELFNGEKGKVRFARSLP